MSLFSYFTQKAIFSGSTRTHDKYLSRLSVSPISFRTTNNGTSGVTHKRIELISGSNSIIVHPDIVNADVNSYVESIENILRGRGIDPNESLPPPPPPDPSGPIPSGSFNEAFTFLTNVPNMETVIQFVTSSNQPTSFSANIDVYREGTVGSLVEYFAGPNFSSHRINRLRYRDSSSNYDYLFNASGGSFNNDYTNNSFFDDYSFFIINYTDRQYVRLEKAPSSSGGGFISWRVAETSTITFPSTIIASAFRASSFVSKNFFICLAPSTYIPLS